MDVLEFLKHLLNEAMQGPYPYIILGVAALLVLLEQIVILSLLSPGSYAVLFASFMAFAGKVPIVLMIALLFVAAMVGTYIQYSLGKHRGSRILHWLNRYPRLVNLERMKQINVRTWLLIVSYSLPQIRGLVPFMAGVSRMPFRRWFAASAVGIALWLTVFVSMGLGAATLFNGNLEKALDWVWQVNSNPILGAIFWGATIGLAVYFVWLWRRPSPSRNAPQVPSKTALSASYTKIRK